MDYRELVKVVVDDFVEEIVDNGFDTFADMARCYQMESEDIRTEVASVINSTKEAFFGEDGVIVIFGEEPIKYRSFIADVRKDLKSKGIYE